LALCLRRQAIDTDADGPPKNQHGVNRALG
jgi:hypothetical protein